MDPPGVIVFWRLKGKHNAIKLVAKFNLVCDVRFQIK
jgi:hypothetical protein